MPSSCDEFSRSELLRRAAAKAGRGLPAIEPGMPAPAGTGLSRRSFLARTAGLAMAVYGASSAAPAAFEEGIASAAAASPEGRVIVSVFQAGGADSLSMLAPTGHARYRTLRPSLQVRAGAGTAFSEDPSLTWHPELEALATLHAEGKVTTLPGVGYTGPDQSHFTSRHYWEVGELNAANRTGWLGRYLDRHGTGDNPLQGLSIAGDLMPSLATARNPVATISRADLYAFEAQGVWGPIPAPMHQAFAALGRAPSDDPALAEARAATANTARLREQLLGVGEAVRPPAGVRYPDVPGFAPALAGLAGMIDAGLPLKAVGLQAPGMWDTHAGQAAGLPKMLRATGDSLLAFQRDLEARGLADRVLTILWSEFGRRPAENATGTDHGAAGAAFVIGSQASGRMVGEFPGLASLDADGNLRATSDFRGLYCSLLEDWLGVDAAPLVPRADRFSRLPIVRR